MREVRQRVTEWAHENGARAEAQRTLTLLTSEIVSNAVQHGPPGGPITVVARRDRTGFRVEVTDTGAGEPVVRPFEVTRARGRGMPWPPDGTGAQADRRCRALALGNGQCLFLMQS